MGKWTNLSQQRRKLATAPNPEGQVSGASRDLSRRRKVISLSLRRLGASSMAEHGYVNAPEQPAEDDGPPDPKTHLRKHS